jgi:hypothetical protein
MPKGKGYNAKKYRKAREQARTRYYKKHKFQGPLTEAQENAAYEEDMREHSRPQRRVKQK